MKRSTFVHAVLGAALMVMGATGVKADDHGKDGQNNGQNNGQNQANAETRLRTRLAGGPIQGKTPEGNADFRVDTARNRSRLNVEVENVNLPAGTVLTVTLQRGATMTPLGTIKLDAFGFGELELNSQDGDAVPAVQAGDMVLVAHGGTILAGVF